MTEQNKELFIEFVNFCESQPEDKAIGYSWEKCAIGAFMEHKHIDPEEIGYSQYTDEVLGPRSYENPLCTLRADIGDGIHPDNYGEFTKFLKQYL